MQTLTKRIFKPDDPFFEDGNMLCRLLQECYAPLHCASHEELDMQLDAQLMDCQIQGCYLHFSSLRSYEEHYATRHRNVCQSCGKVLPTQHLLDLHIHELHNPMFDLLSKQTPSYKCLVSGCSQMFSTTKSRKKHLVGVHRYPPSFRFDRSVVKCKQAMIVNDCQSKMEETVESLSQNEAVTSAQSRFKYSYKVPASFSFGHGAQKGFVRKKRPKGNHLTKSSAVAQEINIEDVDMNELAEAL